MLFMLQIQRRYHMMSISCRYDVDMMSIPIQLFLDLVPGRRRSQDANSIVESLPSSPDWDTSCGRTDIPS